MATQYSNMFVAPIESGGAYTPKGPTPDRPGEVIARLCTFTGTLANADVLRCFGGLAAGERLLYANIRFSGDPDADNDGTLNFGFGSSAAAFLSASTGAQAGSTIEIAQSTALAITTASTEGDTINLVVAAGEFETSRTWYIYVETFIPQF